MSDTVKANVYARCPLGGLPRFLLVTLADEADDEGNVTMNHARVVAKLGVDERTLSRLVTRCIAGAGLQYAPGCGRGSASAFILSAYVDADVVKVDNADPLPSFSAPTKADKVDNADSLPSLRPAAQPAKSPPTRDVFIPPPIPENQEDTDANASGRRRRHSAASAKPKAKWAAESKSVLDRIAVIQGFPVANWARQRLGVNTMLDAGYSPDEIVAAWQACIAEGWHAKRAVAVSAQTVNERIGPLKVAGKLAVGHAVGAVEWGL